MSLSPLARPRGASFVCLACLTLIVALPTFAAPQHAEPPGPGLSLRDVVDLALERNPVVTAATHRRTAASAAVAGVRALPDPTVRFALYDRPLDTLDPLEGQLRLKLTQLFPHPGTLERRADVALEEASRVAEAVPASRARVAASARRAYFDLYLAERARLIHHGHLELVRELSESTEELYAAGRAPQENVLRALQELTGLFTELARVDRDVATARAALNRVLHRMPTASLGRPRAPALDELEGHTLEGLLAAAEASSPALREAAAAERREQSRIAAARHEAKPDFGVSLEWWTASDRMGGRFERISLMGTMTLPWFHDAKYTAAVEEAAASRSEAEANRLAVRDELFERIVAAFERARAAARIAELYRTTLLPQSEQSLAAARAAYETSRVEFLTVVDSERTLLLNRLGLAEIEADYGRAVADLLEAAGVVELDDLRPPAGESTPGERDAGPIDPDRRSGGGA